MYGETKKMAALLLTGALLLSAVGCGKPGAGVAGVSSEAAPQGILLTAAAPERGNLALSTSFVGTVAPDQVVNVMPKMMGTVRQVHVTVGQSVKKGDLLITLDDKDLLPSYQQAEAGYNSAKAQTQQMTGSGYKSNLANLDTSYDSAYDKYEDSKYGVDQAEAALAAAQAKLKATDPNDAAAMAAAKAEVAKAQAAYNMADDGMEMARKYFNNAKNSYNAMKTEGSVELQAVADATLKQAEAGLNMAKAQLENTKLYAPIDGVVESISATELNMVSNSAPALIISNKAALAVTFNVSSAAIPYMKVGDSVRVEKGADTYTATITEVNTILNPQTGLFTVKAAISGAAPALLTGVSVKVMADTEKAENALLLSQDSLYYDDGKPYVYLAVEGRAKKTMVETGISTPDKIEVISGIAEGDLVITSWHPNLMDGVAIALATQEG